MNTEKSGVITNKVEIFETMYQEDNDKIDRTILINGTVVYHETIASHLDQHSTANPKLFIDWLLGLGANKLLVETKQSASEKKSRFAAIKNYLSAFKLRSSK